MSLKGPYAKTEGQQPMMVLGDGPTCRGVEPNGRAQVVGCVFLP